MGIDTAKSVGSYDLLEKIAEGGMGAIYRGRHRQSGQIVAIKIMPPHMAQNPVLLKRFEQEFRAASRLDHPNIVRALDYSDNGNMPYLVMEFVEGESLGQKIEREGRHVRGGGHPHHRPGGAGTAPGAQAEPGPPRRQAGQHPGDVRRHRQAGRPRPGQGDRDRPEPDATGRGLGTPHFMAPEQFRNAKNADIRCDIYSLGATLYQMVTGELPFRSNGPLDAWMKKIQNELTPPRQLVPALTERIDWAIRRAMSADPEKRPSSCREFIEDLTGHSTRRLPAMSDAAVAAGAPPPGAQQELWYLVYKDETGTAHTVKGTVSAVRRSLKDGVLGDASNVRAARTKAGPFEALQGYPEFRDLVIEAAPLSVPKPPSARPSAASIADTVPAQQRLRPEAAAPPAAPPKPHISIDDIAPSRSMEVLKWLFFFVLFAVSAVVAFWFFDR
jgi:hypothetical protein